MVDDRWKVDEKLENMKSFPMHGASVAIINENSAYFGWHGIYEYSFKTEGGTRVCGSKIVRSHACLVHSIDDESNHHYLACDADDLVIDLTAHKIPLKTQINEVVRNYQRFWLYHVKRDEFVKILYLKDDLTVRVWSPKRQKTYEDCLPAFNAYEQFVKTNKYKRKLG